jgi:IS5 family transposase
LPFPEWRILPSSDKGYSSAENRNLLKNSGIKNGIMYSAKRNKPLSAMQKLFNRLVSKVRYKVEQAFGTLRTGIHDLEALYKNYDMRDYGDIFRRFY